MFLVFRVNKIIMRFFPLEECKDVQKSTCSNFKSIIISHLYLQFHVPPPSPQLMSHSSTFLFVFVPVYLPISAPLIYIPLLPSRPSHYHLFLQASLYFAPLNPSSDIRLSPTLLHILCAPLPFLFKVQSHLSSFPCPLPGF